MKNSQSKPENQQKQRSMMWIPDVGLFDRVFNKQPPIRLYGAWEWSRTTTLRFFRPVLRTASKLPKHILDPKERIVGFEPDYTLFNRQLLYHMS